MAVVVVVVAAALVVAGAVASKLHLSVQQIEALNPGVSSNSLRVGQRVRVR